MSTANKHSIWNFVKDLLHEHDCVIVPGFGGFVANKEPSRIDQVSHIITPPRKHLVFNQNLKTNDGLLANRIAEQLKISYADALNTIDESVSKTRDLLQDKKLIAIELFGSFRLNADANYVFLPDNQNNYLHSSFGLMPLQAEPVAGRAIKSAKSRIFNDRKTLRGAKNIKRRRNTVRILSSVFVVLVAVNLFIFIKDPELKIANSTLNISSWFDSVFQTQPAKQVAIEAPATQTKTEPEPVIPPPPVPLENIPAVADSTVTTEIPLEEKHFEIDLLAFAEHISAVKVYVAPEIIVEEQPVEPAPVAEIPDHTEPPIKISKPVKPLNAVLSVDSAYYIIGGVFCKERNAKRYFHELEEKGYAPEILVKSNNCSRVSYSRFSSRKEAEHRLKEIQSSVNPEAWLFIQHN